MNRNALKPNLSLQKAAFLLVYTKLTKFPNWQMYVDDNYGNAIVITWADEKFSCNLFFIPKLDVLRLYTTQMNNNYFGSIVTPSDPCLFFVFTLFINMNESHTQPNRHLQWIVKLVFWLTMSLIEKIAFAWKLRMMMRIIMQKVNK